MATGKWVKAGAVWKPVTNEYVKVGGVQKPVTTNWVKIGGTWKGIPFAKYLFVCEQISDRLYGLDDTPTNLAGWPVYGGGITDPLDVACDNHGVTYWAAGNFVYCLSLAGAVSWSYDHSTTVESVCVDADGNVYTGDLAGTVRKFNSSGSLQWSKSLGANYAVYALAVDYSAGRLYAGTGWAKDAVYRLITSNGNSTLIFTSTYGDVSGIAVDEGLPDLYIGTTGGNLLKISTAGYNYNLYGWGSPSAICTDVHNVRVGHDGYGYCATGAGGSYGKSLYKFNLSTGARVWSYSPGGTACAHGCTVDQFGNVYGTWYVAGGSTTENAVRKVNAAGSLVWTWRPYLNAQLFGCVVTPGAKAAGF
jgi:hypothetical protein